MFEKLADSKRKIRVDHAGEPIPYIFRLDDDEDELRGEDMAYCDDIRALGFKIWLDPNVSIGHVGSKTYDHKIIDQMTMRRVDAVNV